MREEREVAILALLAGTGRGGGCSAAVLAKTASTCGIL